MKFEMPSLHLEVVKIPALGTPPRGPPAQLSLHYHLSWVWMSRIPELICLSGVGVPHPCPLAPSPPAPSFLLTCRSCLRDSLSSFSHTSSCKRNIQNHVHQYKLQSCSTCLWSKKIMWLQSSPFLGKVGGGGGGGVWTRGREEYCKVRFWYQLGWSSSKWQHLCVNWYCFGVGCQSIRETYLK